MYCSKSLPSNALELEEGEGGGREREDCWDGRDGSGSGPFPGRGPVSKSQKNESLRQLRELSPNLQGTPQEKMSFSMLGDGEPELERSDSVDPDISMVHFCELSLDTTTRNRKVDGLQDG
jgi:hypothetical protein